MKKSNNIVDTKIGRGQTIKSAYTPSSHDMEVPDERGGKMGGGTSNLSHSLSGTSAVQK